MSGQYLLPVVDHLLEEEVEAELRLRKQSVDRRETLEDKKRLLRRLFREDRTGYDRTHKFSEEIEKVSGIIDGLISSVRKQADRAQISRLRHYLIRISSSSVANKEEELAQNDLCIQIEGVLKELGLQIKEEEGKAGDDQDKRLDTASKPACLSEAKVDGDRCVDKGAIKKSFDRKPAMSHYEEVKRTTGSRHESDRDSYDESYTEEEDRKRDAMKARKGKPKHGQRQTDSESASEDERDVSRRRRDRRRDKRGSRGRRHSRRSSSSSSLESDRRRSHYRRSRIENWNLCFSGDNRSMQVEDFLFKIKKLARHEDVSERELLKNIHHRLKGEAYDWWFTREDRFTRWSKFEDEIRFRYGNPNRDRGIKAQIRELKQRKGETFIAYVTEIEKLNQCLQRPFSSRTLFELIWENMRPHYRSRLSIMDIYNLEQLIKINHKIDASDPSFYRSSTNARNDVNHIEAEDSCDGYTEEEDAPVQVI